MTRKIRPADRWANLVSPLRIAIITTLLSTHSMAAELTRCNGFDDGAVTWAAVAAGSENPLPLRSLDPSVLLPDGSEFLTWEQPAIHRRTFFVAQQDPKASDDNSGEESRPWKTIGRAAAALHPGDRVIVKTGIYREWVRPVRGGAGPAQMITYQAASGENVILSGSERFAGEWEPSRHEGKIMAGVWVADLPAAWFTHGNPFTEKNLLGGQVNPYWAKELIESAPYSLAQGLVFQDGRRLRQVEDYDALRAAGTYWVEPDGRRVHVRPSADQKPATAVFEFTTRPYALAPETLGLGFIRVTGFTVEHVASCFPIPQRGAISTRQGHHWIIDNNTVRQVNSLGLDFGRRPTFIPFEVPAGTPALGGVGHIIRGNSFSDCGISSMQGLGLIGGLVEDNVAINCSWQGAASLLEAAGIKLHYCKHVLARRNVVRDTVEAPGIWVDHSNVNTRITANTIIGAQTRSGAFFLEASYKPNLIDHNIVWGCNAHAVFVLDCNQLTLANNLFGNCTKLPISMNDSNRGRILDVETNRHAEVRQNRLIGNIFYDFADRGANLPKTENTSDYNLFVDPPSAKQLDLIAWRKSAGLEEHSTSAVAQLDITRELILRQSAPLPRWQSPRPPAVTADFLGMPCGTGETTNGGPFLDSAAEAEIDLKDRRH
jgi:hypothetical protein